MINTQTVADAMQNVYKKMLTEIDKLMRMLLFLLKTVASETAERSFLLYGCLKHTQKHNDNCRLNMLYIHKDKLDLHTYCLLIDLFQKRVKVAVTPRLIRGCIIYVYHF